VVDISALTLSVVCWEGHPACRTRRATYLVTPHFCNAQKTPQNTPV